MRLNRCEAVCLMILFVGVTALVGSRSEGPGARPEARGVSEEKSQVASQEPGNTLEASLELAKQTGRCVLVVFTQPGCVHCEKFCATLASRPAAVVGAICVVRQIDATVDLATRDRFDVHATPEVVVLDPATGSWRKFVPQPEPSAAMRQLTEAFLHVNDGVENQAREARGEAQGKKHRQPPAPRPQPHAAAPRQHPPILVPRGGDNSTWRLNPRFDR